MWLLAELAKHFLNDYYIIPTLPFLLFHKFDDFFSSSKRHKIATGVVKNFPLDATAGGLAGNAVVLCFRVRVGVCRQRWGTFNTLKQMRLGLTLDSHFLACSFSYCSLWGTAVSLTSDIAFNYVPLMKFGWNSSTESVQ